METEQAELKEVAAELTSKNEWTLGRQGTEYKKYDFKIGSSLYNRFQLLISRSLKYMQADPSFTHDVYLIYYPQGSYIPPHRDPVQKNFNHQRLNSIVQHAELGGELLIEGSIVELAELDGMTFFSNKSEHSVAKIERGDRLLWSVGVLQKQTPISEKLAFIIGAGEVGKRMAGALTHSGWKCRLVTRNDEEGWRAAVDPEDEISLRILAMREDDLPPAIKKFDNFPHRNLLVLIQNGFLETILPSELLSTGTRGLIYFTSKGSFYSVLTASLFHGQFATLIAEGLMKGGIAAEAVESRDRFMEHMIIKAIWNGIVGLPLHVHKITLGEYIEQQKDELTQLIHECVLACNAEFNVTVNEHEMYETFISTTKNLLWMKRAGPAYGLATRNQAIERFGQKHNIPTPVTTRLLKENESL